MSVDILVCNYNTKDLIKPMMDAIQASCYKTDVRVLMVDNASSDASAKFIRENYPEVHLVENKQNIGFGRANNQLVQLVKAKYALLLNTDAFIDPNCLSDTVSFMNATPDCGILGVKLLSRDGTLQPSCRYFPTPLNIFLSRSGLQRFLPFSRSIDDLNWNHDEIRECDWVPGCFYLIRREVLDTIGLFDPRFFLYYEEVDHCKRVKQAGWKVCFYPFCTAIHIGGESAKSAASIDNPGRQITELQIESELLYIRKHHGKLGVFCHISLSVTCIVMSLFKALIKRRSQRPIANSLKEIAKLMKISLETGFGIRPTR